MTPRQLADKYPARWLFVRDSYLQLPIGLNSGTSLILDIETDEDGVIVNVIADELFQDNNDRTTHELVADRVGSVLANAYLMAPNPMDMHKIPEWAKESMFNALEALKQRIEDAQTHLDWSKK